MINSRLSLPFLSFLVSVISKIFLCKIELYKTIQMTKWDYPQLLSKVSNSESVLLKCQCLCRKQLRVASRGKKRCKAASFCRSVISKLGRLQQQICNQFRIGRSLPLAEENVASVADIFVSSTFPSPRFSLFTSSRWLVSFLGFCHLPKLGGPAL